MVRIIEEKSNIPERKITDSYLEYLRTGDESIKYNIYLLLYFCEK